MGIEEFPAIESFQRLPKKIIVKGGDSVINKNGDAELAGLVINNLGQPVRDIVVHLIVFDEKEMPVVNLSAKPDSDRLDQGNMASFKFVLEKFGEPIKNYYLYSNWKYDDSQWGG
ncbi:MAG: hypothetical protein HZC17_02115 [Candidatus Omnitrophica bacterium]|nr:hypothetical protein [Candidatus Omnitrophota bacterium]